MFNNCPLRIRRTRFHGMNALNLSKERSTAILVTGEYLEAQASFRLSFPRNTRGYWTVFYSGLISRMRICKLMNDPSLSRGE